jgi:hypothetical protein
MLKSRRILVLTVAIFLVTLAGLQAATYVSLNGEFYITYPDDWEQIDFNTVDLFLSRSNAEASMFDYDAVLAPSASSPFFSGEYLILTVEKAGELSATQVDSVLDIFSNTFTSGITYVTSENLTADLESDVPRYDPTSKVVSVLNDIYQGQEAVKKNLVMMKFYNQGIATFYFYSTDSLFETSRKTFEAMVASFSTDNIESVLPREEVKVADIETDAEGNVKMEKSPTMLYLAVAVFILLVLTAIFIRLRRR